LTLVEKFNNNINLAGIFLLLALLGLIRLPSALWIIDDFAYIYHGINLSNKRVKQGNTVRKAGYYELTAVLSLGVDTF
jgi:hypothetical protein